MAIWGNVDLAAEILAAGSAERFVQNTVTIRDVPALTAACDAQREALRASQSSAVTEAEEVRAAAREKIAAAREALASATTRASEAVSEYDARRGGLQAIADAFSERRAAVAEEEAVQKCRVIADAYVSVIQTLAAHHRNDGKADMDTVAANIETLIREVELVRRAGPKSLFGESLAVNKRILTSIENRCVDAVIKARAAFVNVMDNEFRAFGWPMKVPHVNENDDMISHVNFYVKQLHKLQRVAEKTPFVAQRTRWHRTLSDSWAMASILRAPLARFKYHFLENYHASAGGDAGGDDNASTASSVVLEAESAAAADTAARAATSRFDRPEWAADFALARISEAAPFLREIVLDETITADLKFAEGFCKVFANKIAYDSDIAIRGKLHDEGADPLISHAADIAAQFDAKIRAGIASYKSTWDEDVALPSSLDILSANNDFFANWALAEQRLAQTSVIDATNALLGAEEDKTKITSSSRPDGVPDVEAECAEIVERISQASRGCRTLDSKSRKLSFVKWTELHLLVAVRGCLRAELDECDWKPKSKETVFRAARAAWISHALALTLEDKACDPFYVGLEDLEPDGSADVPQSGSLRLPSIGTVRERDMSNGNGLKRSVPNDAAAPEEKSLGVYDSEIEKLRSFSDKVCHAISNTIFEEFVACASSEYQNLVRFGEVVAPDAAIVLAHDLSEELCSGMSSVETSLEALAEAVPNRKIAAQVWRPTAEALDSFFFDDVILQSWIGGLRNGVTAASSANKYMVAVSAAKMSRQVAHDASVLVEVFRRVTPVPGRWLGRCSEAARLMQVGAARTVRPKAAARQEDEELLAAALKSGGGEESEAADNVREGVGLVTLTARECRECLIIAGMYDSIPMD